MAERGDAYTTMDCDKALTEIMAARRYEMTPFEAAAWTKIIDAVEPSRFIAFLGHHYTTSPYAPTPADATKFLDLAVNPDVSFSRLERMVKERGPYKAPTEIDPVLHMAIELLGGWAQVNEELPDSRSTHDYKRFRERFDACFTEATVKVRINNEVPARPLLPIGGRSSAQIAWQPGGVAALANSAVERSR